jgi:hypothetical protein
MKKDSELTFSIAGFIAVVLILVLASCSKKDIQVPKKQVYFIRVGAVNPTDTIYSYIVVAK